MILSSTFIIKATTMKTITNFIKKSVETIILNSNHAVKSFRNDLAGC